MAFVFLPHLQYMVQVTQFRFCPPMWHRLDLTHERGSTEKAHGFRRTQIRFRPHSYVEINLEWIRSSAHVIEADSLERLSCQWELYVTEKVTVANKVRSTPNSLQIRIGHQDLQCNHGLRGKWPLYMYVCEYRNNPTGNVFVFVCDLFVPMIQTVYSEY